MSRILVAVYESVYVANKAVAELAELGFSADKMYLRPGASQENLLRPRKHEKVHNEMVMDELQAGLGIGACVGSALGITLGILFVLGEFSLLFINQIANGTLGLAPEVAVIIGAGMLAGAILGSILGVLVGLGIPEDEMMRYAKTVSQAQVALVVMSEWGDVDGTIVVLERYDPLEIQQKSIPRKKTGEKEKQRVEQEPNVKAG